MKALERKYRIEGTEKGKPITKGLVFRLSSQDRTGSILADQEKLEWIYVDQIAIHFPKENGFEVLESHILSEMEVDDIE